jgi:hypothetical protein
MTSQGSKEGLALNFNHIGPPVVGLQGQASSLKAYPDFYTETLWLLIEQKISTANGVQKLIRKVLFQFV